MMAEVKKRKKSPGKIRADFADRAWRILWTYLERLEDPEVLAKSDARICAGVVKTLLESVNRAAEHTQEEEPEIELPDIPEKALEEAMRICFPELLPRAPAAPPRAKRTRVHDRQAAAPAP